MSIQCKVEFDENLCIGCGLCVPVCPRKIIALSGQRKDQKGVPVAQVIQTGKCIGCGSCTMICPKNAILITKK